MVKGEAIRYIRNSSSETEYEQKLEFFISKLLTRGYTKSETLNFTIKWVQLIVGSSFPVILEQKKNYYPTLG